MKAKQILIVLIIAGSLISSCTVLSFYPLYTEDELVRDDRIIGKWNSYQEMGMIKDADTMVWKISFNKFIQKDILGEKSTITNNKFTYTAEIYLKSKPNSKATFNLHLVKLNDDLYLDFYPKELNINNPMVGAHLMDVHTFAKVYIDETIKIQWFALEWLKKMFNENKIRIKHEKNNKSILLTAKPKALQKFIVKYGNDEEAFEKGMNYTLNRYEAKNPK